MNVCEMEELYDANSTKSAFAESKNYDSSLIRSDFQETKVTESNYPLSQSLSLSSFSLWCICCTSVEVSVKLSIHFKTCSPCRGFFSITENLLLWTEVWRKMKPVLAAFLNTVIVTSMLYWPKFKMRVSFFPLWKHKKKSGCPVFGF